MNKDNENTNIDTNTIKVDDICAIVAKMRALEPNTALLIIPTMLANVNHAADRDILKPTE